MKKFFKIILLFIFLSSTAIAEVINDVKINGNSRVSDETIKIYGKITLNENYDQKRLNSTLRNLFETKFFEDVNLKIDKSTLIVNVKEYPILNQLIITGEKNLRITRELKKNITLKEKNSFIESDLVNDVEKIKNIYASLGFNNAEVTTKIKSYEDKIDLIFEIKPGNITRISTISFLGDKKISDKRLRDIIASEEHKFWKVISRNTKFSTQLILLDERLLKNYYKSLGYNDVKINSSSATINENNNIDITFSIEAGQRYKVNKISTNVDGVLDKKIFNPMQKIYKNYIGDYYSPFSIKEILEEIDLIIDENNLQFIEHNVEEIINADTIEIKFNIFETEKVLVDRINIIGNNVTDEEVIRGELLLDEGDPFSELALNKSISNLKARGIFSDVNYETTSLDDKSLKEITINVEEQPTGEISAGAGVGSNGGSFAFIVSENNWLGKGNKINFELEVDSESIGGRFNYTDNNHNFSGNKLNYFVSSTSNDKPNQGYENTVISSGINKNFEQFKNFFIDLGISASYDDLRTQNNASASLKKQKGQFADLSGSYGFKLDKRNRSFMPTKGYVSSFNQTLPIYADKQAIGNTFTFSSYKLITEDIVGAGKFYFTSINGLDDDVRLSKRKSLSSNRLRGFERGKVGPVDGSDHIGGNYAASFNLEANLPNLLPESSKAEIGTFLDFGNVWGVDYDNSIDESNKLRSSAGVAINWSSPIGPMSFVLSSNLQKASSDETESFTFNLGTTF